jgi:hypothetical protein
MPRREEVAEAAEAAEVEVEAVAVAAELRMPWAAADISAAAECISVVVAAECVLVVRPMSAVVRVWVACVSAARLASPAGRPHRGLRRVPLSAASVRLRHAAVQAGPPAAPQR